MGTGCVWDWEGDGNGNRNGNGNGDLEEELYLKSRNGVPNVDAPFQVFNGCIVAGAQRHATCDWHYGVASRSHQRETFAKGGEAARRRKETGAAPVFQPFSSTPPLPPALSRSPNVAIVCLCFLPYRLFRCCHNLLLLPLSMLLHVAVAALVFAVEMLQLPLVAAAQSSLCGYQFIFKFIY